MIEIKPLKIDSEIIVPLLSRTSNVDHLSKLPGNQRATILYLWVGRKLTCLSRVTKIERSIFYVKKNHKSCSIGFKIDIQVEHTHKNFRKITSATSTLTDF